jgi:hypothetical protein
MPWYRVTKKIKGRHYDYLQRTYRVGKSVKTENRYIGPSTKSGFTTSAASAASNREPLYAGQFEIPIATGRATEQRNPRNIRELQKQKKAILLAPRFDHLAFSVVQDELDYAYAVKIDKERKRAARAKTKGIKALNMFMAQALLAKRDR